MWVDACMWRRRTSSYRLRVASAARMAHVTRTGACEHGDASIGTATDAVPAPRTAADDGTMRPTPSEQRRVVARATRVRQKSLTTMQLASCRSRGCTLFSPTESATYSNSGMLGNPIMCLTSLGVYTPSSLLWRIRWQFEQTGIRSLDGSVCLSPPSASGCR